MERADAVLPVKRTITWKKSDMPGKKIVLSREGYELKKKV